MRVGDQVGADLERVEQVKKVSVHVFSCVESLTCIFMYDSPSNTYLIILLLGACTYPLSMFCVIPPNLGCCSLHFYLHYMGKTF